VDVNGSEGESVTVGDSVCIIVNKALSLFCYNVQ
jgi:hypothetical protein